GDSAAADSVSRMSRRVLGPGAQRYHTGTLTEVHSGYESGYVKLDSRIKATMSMSFRLRDNSRIYRGEQRSASA
ncbi:MAG: hypothetical protein QOJ29_2237, partial [Thermoleophilaceae bacterium]|nr:hypothetical protein [Thermoleophilaceae bacterium]